MKIGILSLQGDFLAHAKSIEQLGHTSVLVKKAKDFQGICGLILPGGESTTHIRLLKLAKLTNILKDFYRQEFPILGTCAGLILIAEKVLPESQFSFEFLPVWVERNAYGSQKDSFIENVFIESIGKPLFPCIFIRAPRIIQLGSKVQVLASFEDTPILVKHKKVMGATFHPELAQDLRIHRMFVEMCEEEYPNPPTELSQS